MLKKTAAFIAVESAASRAPPPKEVSDFIETGRRISRPSPDGTDIDLRRAAGAIRSITIEQARKNEHVVGDMSASRSAMDLIEAKSAEGLPAELLFRVIPYEGLQAQTIQLRLAVLTGGDKPMLRLRWIGEAQLREDLAQEFKYVVSEESAAPRNSPPPASHHVIPAVALIQDAEHMQPLHFLTLLLVVVLAVSLARIVTNSLAKDRLYQFAEGKATGRIEGCAERTSEHNWQTCKRCWITGQAIAKTLQLRLRISLSGQL